MDCRLFGVQQLHHTFCLGVHGATGGQIGNRLGHVEEAGDPSGRRGVDDDGVVGGALLAIHPDRRLLDLAGQEHIPQTRGDRGGEFDCSDPAHGASGDAQVVEHFEVFQEGRLDFDG